MPFPFRRPRLRAGLLLAASLGVCPLVGQAGEVDELTRNLVELRGQVEELNDQLEIARAEHELKMRTLLSRKGDLENQMRRQELEIERLRKSLDKLRERAQAATAGAQDLLPAVHAAIGALERYIRSHLPFKVDERIAALREIRSKLDSGVLTASKAVNRVWSFCEDELRLARESGLYRQPISVDGSEKLAEVARLGMVMLYYRSDDGELGMARRSGADWQFAPIADSGAQAQVSALFDALNKQVRTGYFELPNPDAENAL